ncbi:hypothetical protein, partial [Bacteroides thetaiotaomicron]|uniref:hypothetical protein n=1 Tax=Bacteroides thetaiotaomicron TaxID=818 RepID=UPI0020C78408
ASEFHGRNALYLAHPLRLYKPHTTMQTSEGMNYENKPHRVPLPLPIPQRHRMGRFTNTIIVQLYDFKRQGWAIAPVWAVHERRVAID